MTNTQSNRPNKNYILDCMRDDDIAGDPWGTAMSWAFAVAETLTVIGADVPSELGYQPSPYVRVEDIETYEPESYPDSEVWAYLNVDASGMWDADTEARVTEVQTAGKCLHLYIELCREAGLDY